VPSRESTASAETGAGARAVLELNVNHHAGVMSHVCGLFARRGYNVEGIVCVPPRCVGGERSRIWLLVADDARLGQMVKHVAKLEDVIDVRRHDSPDEVFARLEAFFHVC